MHFKIAHTNINVYDLDRSIGFYQRALGLDVIGRHQAADGRFEIVFLGDADRRYFLELTWLRGHEPYQLGDNESHICFETDDMVAAHDQHSSMNCICFENKDMGLYFIEDPDGYWIEIVPRKAQS